MSIPWSVQVLACPGPLSTGTRADYVKFHDDKVRRSSLRCDYRGLPGSENMHFHVRGGRETRALQSNTSQHDPVRIITAIPFWIFAPGGKGDCG